MFLLRKRSKILIYYHSLIIYPFIHSFIHPIIQLNYSFNYYYYYYYSRGFNISLKISPFSLITFTTIFTVAISSPCTLKHAINNPEFVNVLGGIPDTSI